MHPLNAKFAQKEVTICPPSPQAHRVLVLALELVLPSSPDGSLRPNQRNRLFIMIVLIKCLVKS